MPALLTRRRLLYAIQETTPGTAQSVASPPLVVPGAMNPRLNAQIGMEAREGSYGFGALRSVPTVQIGELTFETELFGSASTTWATLLLPACNVTLQSGSYKPVSVTPHHAGSASKTLTFYHYQDGRRRVLRGAMGTFRIRGTAGQRLVAEWTFRGRLDQPTDVALPTYSTPSALPLQLKSASISIGSVSPVVKEFTFDLGNEIQVREAADQAAGVANAVIVNRRTTGSIVCEGELIATHDPDDDLYDATLRALSASFTAGSGNSLALAVPDLQITAVQQDDRNGIVVQSIDWLAVRDDQTSSGDDEFALTLS